MGKRKTGWRNSAAMLLIALGVAANAGSLEDTIQEVQKLNEQALKLYDQGQYQKATPIAQRAVEVSEQALEPQHPDTATALDTLAQLYRATDSYAQAEPLYQRALAIREKVLGPEHERTATSLSNLASLYYDAGAYAQAKPPCQRALAIREKVLGPEHPDTAVSLNTLANLYRATGAYAQAEPLYERALAIREKVLGPEHPKTAVSLTNLANLYVNMGAYAQATRLSQRALAIREKVLGAEHPDTANSLLTLANLYSHTGAYARAKPLCHRALVIREKVFGPEHPNTADSLNTLANIYSGSGAHSQAELLYQRALAILEKTLGPTHPRNADLLLNLGELYWYTGAYTQAEPLYQRTLAIREKVLGPEHPTTAAALNNLAVLYRATGAYAKAEPLYQRALAIHQKALGPEHDRTAASLNNLANLYLDTGAYAKAEPLYQRALAIHEKTLGPKHPRTADLLLNLGDLYSAIGAHAKAEPLYQRALAIHEKRLGPEHDRTAASLNGLGELYYATGAYAKSGPLIQRALAIREKALGSGHPDVASSLNTLAVLNWARGDSAKALPSLERAQVIQARNSERFLLTGSEARKQAYLQGLAKDTYRNVSFSVSVPSPASIALGVTGVLQYKGRVLDAMSGSVARLRQSVKPADRELFEQLAQVANQSSTLTYQGIGNLSPAQYRQRLEQLSQRQEGLEADLAKRSGEFRQQVAPVTLAAVSGAIPAGAVLVEWFRYQPFDPKVSRQQSKARYVAYLLKRRGDPILVDIGDAQVIETSVREFLKAVNNSARSDVKELARNLADKIVKPLRAYLAGTERVLISPDGALNLVPMAALMDDNGQYLIQRFEMTYLTSGRDVLRMASASGSQNNAVVVADPDYGKQTRLMAQAEPPMQAQRSADLDRSGLMFRPLANTALEARAIRALLKLDDVNVLTQLDASEANLRQLHGPRILHVASHGFFLNDQALAAELGPKAEQALGKGENPLLRSGIALAGANARRSGANDDGILTALEAAQLDLHGTELVVLSACESGIGQVQNGEGVYGLRRALFLAGAQTQVTSLWKVPDEATRTLMVDYYQRLLKGEGRSAALREAQKTLLAIPRRSHPYYWAGFVPIGNWAPMPSMQ